MYLCSVFTYHWNNTHTYHWIPNAKHTQIIKNISPIINRKLYFFTYHWTYSLIVRPIATSAPVGLDLALPTEGRTRSVASLPRRLFPCSALASPIPALPRRLRSFPQNVWNSFQRRRRGTNFIRFVYTTPNFTPFSEYGASLRPELIWKIEFLISGGVRFQIFTHFYIYFTPFSWYGFFERHYAPS